MNFPILLRATVRPMIVAMFSLKIFAFEKSWMKFILKKLLAQFSSTGYRSRRCGNQFARCSNPRIAHCCRKRSETGEVGSSWIKTNWSITRVDLSITNRIFQVYVYLILFLLKFPRFNVYTAKYNYTS